MYGSVNATLVLPDSWYDKRLRIKFVSFAFPKTYDFSSATVVMKLLCCRYAGILSSVWEEELVVVSCPVCYWRCPTADVFPGQNSDLQLLQGAK
jgi:hypothetical protein